VTESKQLSILSFAAHATRGLIRNQTTRRKTMFFLIVVALVLLFAGSTVLQSMLNPHEHPGWFILFWAVCGWLTLTAILLAIFDLLFVRMEARKAERISREKFSQTGNSDSSRSRE
jgi:protein-S-isoprenylcysteine O-methyltransferase Ste14